MIRFISPPEKKAYCTWCKTPTWVYQPACEKCDAWEDASAKNLWPDGKKSQTLAEVLREVEQETEPQPASSNIGNDPDLRRTLVPPIAWVEAIDSDGPGRWTVSFAIDYGGAKGVGLYRSVQFAESQEEAASLAIAEHLFAYAKACALKAEAAKKIYRPQERGAFAY